MKDQLSKSTAIGVEKFGRPHKVSKVLKNRKKKKKNHLVLLLNRAGDLEIKKES